MVGGKGVARADSVPCEVPQPFRNRIKRSELNTFSVLLFIIQGKGVRKSTTELSVLSFETGVNFRNFIRTRHWCQNVKMRDFLRDVYNCFCSGLLCQ